MKSHTRLAIALATAALAASALPGVAAAQQSHVTITMADARTRALHQAPGTVHAQELEREHGRMIYSFEIQATGAPAGAITEVNIDANDGSVVSVEHERASGGNHRSEGNARRGEGE